MCILGGNLGQQVWTPTAMRHDVDTDIPRLVWEAGRYKVRRVEEGSATEEDREEEFSASVRAGVGEAQCSDSPPRSCSQG